MNLARIIGLIMAPSGVLVGGWAVTEILAGGLSDARWVPIAIGLGLAFAMILVGVRYLLKKPGSKA